MNPTVRRKALMRATTVFAALPTALFAGISERALRGGRERGDVPGWVMITLMSALLVAALLAIAGPRLQDLFNQAIDRVSGLG